MTTYIDKLADLVVENAFEDRHGVIDQRSAVKTVRAILTAMREPTSEMALAGLGAFRKRDSTMHSMFRAMIDAALQD